MFLVHPHLDLIVRGAAEFWTWRRKAAAAQNSDVATADAATTRGTKWIERHPVR